MSFASRRFASPDRPRPGYHISTLIGPGAEAPDRKVAASGTLSGGRPRETKQVIRGESRHGPGLRLSGMRFDVGGGSTRPGPSGPMRILSPTARGPLPAAGRGQRLEADPVRETLVGPL